MIPCIDFAAFRELKGYFDTAAEAADRRRDAIHAAGARALGVGLMTQVPPPDLRPRDMDELLWERAVAHDLTTHAEKRTSLPYTVVRRQGDYARRLDALATQRGQA